MMKPIFQTWMMMNFQISTRKKILYNIDVACNHKRSNQTFIFNFEIKWKDLLNYWTNSEKNSVINDDLFIDDFEPNIEIWILFFRLKNSHSSSDWWTQKKLICIDSHRLNLIETMKAFWWILPFKKNQSNF